MTKEILLCPSMLIFLSGRNGAQKLVEDLVREKKDLDAGRGRGGGRYGSYGRRGGDSRPRGRGRGDSRGRGGGYNKVMTSIIIFTAFFHH